MNICFSTNTASAFKDYMFEYMVRNKRPNCENLTFDTSKTFEEKEALLNKAIMADIERVAGIKFSDDMLTPEVMANHPNFKFAAFAVVGQLIDTIVPDVINRSIGVYTETRFGNFGDSFRFDIEPNDLFFVSRVGRDQRSVEFQRQFTGTQYIVPENHAISVYVNLFRVLCGLDSLAKFVMKAIVSMEADITKNAYDAINTALTALPSPGTLHLTAAGGAIDKTSAIKLVQTVTAYNGGAEAMFVGTKAALSYLFPTSDSGFRYFDAGISYFRNVWGVDTLELAQVANYKDKYNLALDDNKIFVISPAQDKLLKLCYEGATMTVDMKDTANHLVGSTLNKSYGMGIATNAIAGVIEITA